MRLLRSSVTDFTVNVDQITSIYIMNGVKVEDNGSILADKSRSSLCCDLIDGNTVYLACSNPETIRFYRYKLEEALVDLNGDKIIDIDDLI